jgi:hypothetical protein
MHAMNEAGIINRILLREPEIVSGKVALASCDGERLESKNVSFIV